MSLLFVYFLYLADVFKIRLDNANVRCDYDNVNAGVRYSTSVNPMRIETLSI